MEGPGRKIRSPRRVYSLSSRFVLMPTFCEYSGMQEPRSDLPLFMGPLGAIRWSMCAELSTREREWKQICLQESLWAHRDSQRQWHWTKCFSEPSFYHLGSKFSQYWPQRGQRSLPLGKCHFCFPAVEPWLPLVLPFSLVPVSKQETPNPSPSCCCVQRNRYFLCKWLACCVTS